MPQAAPSLPVRRIGVLLNFPEDDASRSVMNSRRLIRDLNFPETVTPLTRKATTPRFQGL
jgi:hypothetical protein